MAHGDPRDHHYVPIFYQSGFADPRGFLHVYDRQWKKYQYKAPKGICYETDFYALQPDGQPKNQIIEKQYLQVIDDIGSRAIQVLGQKSDHPKEDTLAQFAFFAAHQILRSPAMRELVNSTIERTITDVAEMAFATVDRARDFMETYGPGPGEPPDDTTPEEMVEIAKQVTIKATELPFLQFMVSTSRNFTEILTSLDVEILQSPTDTGFIISDHPFVIVPNKDGGHRALLAPRAIKYFPVNRRCCIAYGERGGGRSVRRVNKEFVRSVNLNIAANSDRYIIGPDLDQLQHVVERSSSASIDADSRYSTTKIVDTLDQKQ